MTRPGKVSTAGLKRRRVAAGHVPAGRPAARDHGVPEFERNIYSQLAGRLGQEIVAGLYENGSLLPNAQEMCTRFSVSRTALREAYSILNAKGLIFARPKIGTRVRPKSEWNLLDPEVLAWHLAATPSEHLVGELFVLRQMVEPAAAALAAAAPARETVQRIAEAYDRMERFKNGEGDLIGADLDFHMAILEASGNRFVAALGGLIHTALEITFRLSWRGAAGIQDNRLLQHREVFEAIRDGAPERARERMAALLRDSIGDVREYLRQRDEAAALAAAP
ncbi:GntR family transcriptional regulator [Roseiarcus fermentans]|uniref:GntR family transcriptional regulator n=1 Tax=Roseiarcus fermentans TaxID=1473586 RepID=A0A366FGN2_9HYPH|nr:FadR/GntR family transcriptional regulator [Roseiarcus fermentans]RBP13818.1 GntR family transcriptional regulator [Roseiarcus fermentans]